MDLVSVSLDVLLPLFCIAVVAGFIDTLAGGGGLISLPALMLSGVPPLAALGTNKLQGSMGTATATFILLKNKKIYWAHIKPFMLAAFLGAAIGAGIIQCVNTAALAFVIPIVLLCIATYFLISPLFNLNASKPKLTEEKYKTWVLPAIGCYDGMFGPGTGSFFALAGVALRGQALIPSTAIAKPLNFATNVASLMVFLVAGKVVWTIGFSMMLGQVLGAWLGAHSLFKINPAYLRVVVILMCTGMLIKYCYSVGWLSFVIFGNNV